MSEHSDNRKQIDNRNILRLRKDGLTVKAISKMTGHSQLHVSNTIKRCNFDINLKL